MLAKIHIIISIAAALVMTVIGIVLRMPVQTLAVRIIYTIVIFYFFGCIVKAYLQKKVFPGQGDQQDGNQKPEQTEQAEGNRDESIFRDGPERDWEGSVK